MEHRLEDVIELFDGLFLGPCNTRLVRGGDEPLYLPADDQVPWHRVIFARGFFASVLHEVSHWCIAGPRRRLLEDYGYWYEPDGRNETQQQAFEKVEVAPQALERIFSEAAGADLSCQRRQSRRGGGRSRRLRPTGGRACPALP